MHHLCVLYDVNVGISADSSKRIHATISIHGPIEYLGCVVRNLCLLLLFDIYQLARPIHGASRCQTVCHHGNYHQCAIIVIYFGSYVMLMGAANGFGAMGQMFGLVGIVLLIMLLVVICMYTSLLRSTFRAVDDYCRQNV